MHISLATLAPLLSLVIATRLLADPVHVTGLVELSASADEPQPRFWPILISVTLTNVGSEPVEYWCGGPGRYPAATEFRVSVRYNEDEDWQEPSASNGQYTQGSGDILTIARDQEIIVPLAIPVDSSQDSVSIRIDSRSWHSKAPVEIYVRINDNVSALDCRRAEAVAAATGEGDSFHRHVAERYGDEVVIDAMLKLATIDNANIVARAAKVLSANNHLPIATGNQLAPLVAQWAPRRGQRDCDLAAIYLTKAALNTQSPAARRVVLELLDATTDAQVIAMLMDELRLSPGDATWLYELRGHFERATPRTTHDERAKQSAKAASEWLESRIKVIESTQDKQ